MDVGDYAGCGFGGEQNGAGAERDFGELREHFGENGGGDVGFGEGAEEAGLELRGVGAVAGEIVGFDAFGVIAEGALEGFERAEVGVGEAAREHAADVGSLFEEEDRVAVSPGIEGGGDTGGGGPKNDDVEVSGAADGDEEKRDEQAHQNYGSAKTRDGAGHPFSANSAESELIAGDRFRFVVEDFKDRVELSDLQEILHALGQIQELQATAMVGNGGEG